MDLRQKLELVIEMAPKLRAAGVQGRVETEEIDFELAPAELGPAGEANGEGDRVDAALAGDDPTDLRPKAIRDRERERNMRGASW